MFKITQQLLKNISINKIQPKDIDAVAQFISKIFVKEQPIAKHLQLKQQDFYDYVYQHLITKKRQRSFVAKDGDKVISAIINSLGSDPIISYSQKWEWNMKIYTDDFEEIQYELIKNQKIPLNQIFYFGMGACAMQYASHGVFSKLMDVSFDEAKSLGCKQVIANGTNERMDKIFMNKFGFTKIGEYKFSELDGSLKILRECEGSDKFTQFKKSLI